jgi:hypothetical protein
MVEPRGRGLTGLTVAILAVLSSNVLTLVHILNLVTSRTGPMMLFDRSNFLCMLLACLMAADAVVLFMAVYAFVAITLRMVVVMEDDLRLHPGFDLRFVQFKVRFVDDGVLLSHVDLGGRRPDHGGRVFTWHVAHFTVIFVCPFAMTAHALAMVRPLQTRLSDVFALKLRFVTAAAFGMGLILGCLVVADHTSAGHPRVRGVVERHWSEQIFALLVIFQHVQ